MTLHIFNTLRPMHDVTRLQYVTLLITLLTGLTPHDITHHIADKMYWKCVIHDVTHFLYMAHNTPRVHTCNASCEECDEQRDE